MKKLRAFWDKTAAFLKEVKVEMQKVSWPNKDEIVSYTVVVLITVLILTIIIGIEDRVIGAVLGRILHMR
jgi:preprotein translocase subunit SecE